jgi:hypothetical protein
VDVVAFIVAAAAIVILPLVAVASPAAAHAWRAVSAAEDALALAEKGDLDFASDKAFLAEREFAAGRVSAARLHFLSSVPVVGEYVTVGETLFETGEAGAAAAAEFLGVASDLAGSFGDVEKITEAVAGADLSAITKDLRPETRHQLLATLTDDLPRLTVAAEKASLAVAAFDRLPEKGLGAVVRARLLPVRDRLASVRDAVAAALPFVESLPAAMGYPEPRSYLVFFQNNTELRPTGGFLGVYGLLTLKDAEIASFETDDVYALDGPSEGKPRPAAPAPIQRYLGVAKWYLRDANWSPDFPTAAVTMERFFREEATVVWGDGKVPSVDGVIAIDPELVKGVLSVIGPVKVDGKTFTPDNVVDELEFEVEKGYVTAGISMQERKGIVSRLTDAVMARLGSASVSELVALAGVFDASVKEKHFLAWFKDANLQKMAADAGWTGELTSGPVDSVAVFDANLASLKTDQTINRSVRYSFRPDGSGLVGSVAVTYANRGSFTWKTTRYRTYARVFLPPGTEFVEVRGAMKDDKIKDPARRPGTADVGDELGRRWFGAFVSVEPGETRTLEFRFRIAPAVVKAVAAGEYRLIFAKQPGTVAPGLTLDLNFGKKLMSAVPGEERKEWGDTRYLLKTDLRIDREFRVKF